jgi:hypothetical protein
MVQQIGRSLGALFAGALAGIVLSIGTDMLLRAAGVLPALGKPMGDRRFLLATAYRTIYGIAGSYLAARARTLLADGARSPARGGWHRCVHTRRGGDVGNKGPGFGPHWYPLALVALGIPQSWVGGRLRELQLSRRVDG